MASCEQGRLFDDDGQASHLARCREKLAEAILQFCRDRLGCGLPDFHAEDLRDWCEGRVAGLAPDSPSRVLRLLRREGRVGYGVVSRKDSLYRLTWCEPG